MHAVLGVAGKSLGGVLTTVAAKLPAAISGAFTLGAKSSAYVVGGKLAAAVNGGTAVAIGQGASAVSLGGLTVAVSPVVATAAICVGIGAGALATVGLLGYLTGSYYFMPEEVGHAFINVRTHVPVTTLNYIPHCIPACNLPTEKLRSTDYG